MSDAGATTAASSVLEIEARCQSCGWRWTPATPVTLERGRSQAKRHARQHGRAHRGHVTEYSARIVSVTARGSRIALLDVEITQEGA
jgi:hypothetical protein